jgi:KDO2-lipid IV(A) lauroyltransferase
VVIGESPVKDAWRLVAWGPWRWALEAAPPGWEFRANRAVGALAGRVAVTTRTRVADNLARAFPAMEAQARARLARRTFPAHFANQYASFSFARVTPATLSAYVRWEGLHHLEEARRDGVGVVLVHPHMGPAQLPLCALGAAGWPVHQVGGGPVTLARSALGRWATDTRARLDARLPARLLDARGFLREAVRALRAGGIVLTAGDGTGGGVELGRRVVVPVFGQPYRMPVAAARLAALGGARVHPLHCVADGDVHRAVIGPVLAWPEADPEHLGAARVLATWLEGVVRAHPEEWLLWDAFVPGGLLVEAP